jgi:catechol 2,3-dioxygenase
MKTGDATQPFRLPADTHIGHVHLQVADLNRSLGFYRDLLGFRLVSLDGPMAMLSATGQAPYHVLLTERPGARRKPPRTTGLYHVAIRYPSRRSLARTLRRLMENEWPFEGFADHKVSEALYLTDPDGNGVELYADRPRDGWLLQGGQVVMATDPIDLQNLLAEVAADTAAWDGADPGTDIGHVHLHVSDLARAEAFYHGLLGLDVTQRGYPGALFLSAGGYHHHLAVNVWAGVGAPPPPLDAAGLVSFALYIPDEETWETLQKRIERAGLETENRRDYGYAVSIPIADPAGNGVELLVAKK